MVTNHSSWNGTWIGNWQNGPGAQIVFAGDVLIAVYWGGDYLPETRSTASADGSAVTIIWPSGQAILTRVGEKTGHIEIREEDKPETSFDVTREGG